MTKPITSGWSDDAPRAVIEYSLLLAFLAIAVLALSISFNKPAAGSATISHLVDVSATVD